MDAWQFIFPVLGYFFGAFPTAYLLVRWKTGTDIRQVGSGNVGSTNALRVLGRGYGFLVLAIDIGKVLLILTIARAFQASYHSQLLTAAAAVIGHNWPVFLGFKGGKGVAVSVGLLFWFYPMPGLIALTIFVLVFLASHYVSLGSMLAAASVPIVLILLRYPGVDIAYSAFLAGLLIYRHRANIRRLREGTENKISFAAKS